MEKLIMDVLDHLTRNGIVVDAHTLAKHSIQGFMSGVYTVSSSRGDLIVHILKPGAESRRQLSWQKASVIYEMLKDSPIPVAEIYASIDEGLAHVTVQQKLPGVNAGTRALDGLRIVDTWNISPEVMGKVEVLLAQTHAIPAEGFGWVTNSAKNLYPSWQEFLEAELPIWLQSIALADEPLAHKVSGYLMPLSKHRPYEGRPFLVHNDMTNPSNILVSGEGVCGIIDWEWSLFGDPAWEFGFNNEYALIEYFRERNMQDPEEQRSFRLRMELNKVLYLAWGLHVHAEKAQGPLFQSLRQYILDAV
jgi:hypothetical protein